MKAKFETKQLWVAFVLLFLCYTPAAEAANTAHRETDHSVPEAAKNISPTVSIGAAGGLTPEVQVKQNAERLAFLASQVDPRANFADRKDAFNKLRKEVDEIQGNPLQNLQYLPLLHYQLQRYATIYSIIAESIPSIEAQYEDFTKRYEACAKTWSELSRADRSAVIGQATRSGFSILAAICDIHTMAKVPDRRAAEANYRFREDGSIEVLDPDRPAEIIPDLDPGKGRNAN